LSDKPAGKSSQKNSVSAYFYKKITHLLYSFFLWNIW
jgi:hypothetical protein